MMNKRLTPNEVREMIRRQDHYSGQTKDSPAEKIIAALTEAYVEADESVVLREMLNIQTRRVVEAEQANRELMAQSAIGESIVTYAPMFYGTHAEIDLNSIPKGHAVVFTDDPPKSDKNPRRAEQ
jgi:hypothetical protein